MKISDWILITQQTKTTTKLTTESQIKLKQDSTSLIIIENQSYMKKVSPKIHIVRTFQIFLETRHEIHDLRASLKVTCVNRV